MMEDGRKKEVPLLSSVIPYHATATLISGNASFSPACRSTFSTLPLNLFLLLLNVILIADMIATPSVDVVTGKEFVVC